MITITPVNQTRVDLPGGLSFFVDPPIAHHVNQVAVACAVMAQNNHFIEAIRLARTLFQCHLREAKVFVEQARDERPHYWRTLGQETAKVDTPSSSYQPYVCENEPGWEEDRFHSDEP